MTAVAGRRVSVVVVAVLALGGLVGGARADTGFLTYSCALPVLGATDFQIGADTNVPATLYLGRSYTPTLTTKAQIPANLVSLVTEQLKATTVDGTIVSKIKTNNVFTPITQTIGSKVLPTTADTSSTVVATGPMPKQTASAPGTVTYLPGDLVVSLNFHKAGGGSVGEFKNINCTLQPTTKVVDTFAKTKSPTKVTPTATYAKATKKVTATAKVTATSRLVPTGKVSAVLYKGTAKVKTITTTLAAGKATATFAGVSAKGTYKVVLTYAGSATNTGSSASKAFTVR